MLMDYRLSRGEIMQRLQGESEKAIGAVIIDMENWLANVESSTLLLARVLQQTEYSHADLEKLLLDVVEVNGDIFGATIALAQPGTPAPGHARLGFAPYYYRRDGRLEYVDLAGLDRNYQQQAWYTDTVRAGEPLWVEPYFDEAGGKILMTTFAVPVYRRTDEGQRALYAVITADVALAKLHDYLQRLRLGNSGFGLLLSRGGTILSAGNPANIMRHYSEVVSDQLDRTAWEEMFNAALQGRVTSSRVACSDGTGHCVIRLGSLQSTGWPVGVVYSEDELTAPLRAYELKAALIGLLTLLLMAAAVAIITRRLTRPLTDLALASDRVAQGDLEAPLPAARGNDEVATLINSFGAMKRDLKTHIADLEAAAARRSRLESELGAAREIQMAMLQHGGEASEREDAFSLWARVTPARSVGGDLYSYFRRDRCLFLAVGDVSDKGIPAALFMARAISLIQQAASTAGDPAEAMAELNDALVGGNDNCMFVTLFLGVLDLDSLELRFSSAGHTAPSLVRDQAATSLAQDRGPALGLAPHLSFPVMTVQLQAGDRLAVFTDGIDEAFNERDQMFGLDRFNQALLASRALPVSVAGDSLFAILAAFAGDRPQSDDIGLLLLDIAARGAGIVHSAGEFKRGPQLTRRVEEWLRRELARLALPEQTRGDLVLVVEEIVSNIDKYAGIGVDAVITVTLEADSRQVAVEARDTGTAFDPLAEARRAQLGAATDEAEVGGLGIHLITALTDRQSYRREGGCNILRVIKFLESPPA